MGGRKFILFGALLCVLSVFCLTLLGGADRVERTARPASADGAGGEADRAKHAARAASADADIPQSERPDRGGPEEQNGGGEGSPPKAAALTFDDGPHPGTTDRLLDGLRERGVKATFFLVGEEAAGNRELVRRIAEEGHQVGNHTWSHRRLDAMEREEAVQETGKTEALLESILGGSGYWLRPPYGFLPQGAEDSAGTPSAETPLVKWSVDPRDWESRDREKIAAAVLDAVEPGSIILLHDIYPASVDAALDIADALKRQGYSLVTVAELLSLYGREPVPGEIIRSGAA